MRRTLLALAAACLAAALLVAGPALSVRPYEPRALDFEVTPPALGAASAHGAYTSPPIEAPKRFNLVGLRWSGGAGEPLLSMRFRSDGGVWSHWRRVGAGQDHAPDPDSGEAMPRGASDPVWVGEADQVQYRLSRRVSGVRLHFVNTLGTATAADRARTALRRAANGALRTVAAAVGVHSAQAQDPAPQINPRSSWDNTGQCVPRSAPAYREVKVAFVHHTVNANDYPPEQVPAMMLAICRYHRNSNGWNDIGYNFVVDRQGRIWEARAGGVDQPVVGAHTEGMNTQSTGIANLGTFSYVGVTPEAMDAMARLIRWKLPLHGQPTSGQTTVVSNGGGGSKYGPGQEAVLDRVSGHRDANNTSCPGDALYAQLPELRERVAGAAVPERPATTVTEERPPRRLPMGTLVKVRGTIGPPKESLSILVERKTGDTWQRWYGRTIPAKADGSWIKKVRFRYAGLYRVSALFGGDGSNTPARSKAYPVRVPRPPKSYEPTSP